MDKDIREFLDRAEQNRLYEARKKRKEKRIAKKRKHENRKSRRNAANGGSDLSCGERVTVDRELSLLVHNGRDYSSVTKYKIKHRSPKEQKKFDWENRPRFILTPMGGQNKKR